MFNFLELSSYTVKKDEFFPEPNIMTKYANTMIRTEYYGVINISNTDYNVGFFNDRNKK